jgi:hypothetical protein
VAKIEQSSELWVVRDDDGLVVNSFKTNSEAWRWLEAHERDPIWLKGKRKHRAAIEPHHQFKRREQKKGPAFARPFLPLFEEDIPSCLKA